MKHMRKALSLFLALAMIICFAVPAFAADTDTATVTVYVTTGMFTPGGYDPDHGTFLEQEFRTKKLSVITCSMAAKLPNLMV